MPSSTGNVLVMAERWRVHLSRGVRALESGDYDQAQVQFAQAHRMAPDRAETCAALGREYLRRGRIDQAEPLLRGARAKDPDLLSAVAALARLLGLGRGRLGEAQALIDDALLRHQSEPTLLMVKGELLLEADRIPEARAVFERALEAGGDPEVARAGLARTCNAEGISLSEDGQDEAAVFWFKRAADLDAAWAGPHVNLGVVFARLGRPGRAREEYERAIGIDPLNPVVFFNLGNLCRVQGDNEQAARAYQRVLELAPDYPHVRGALADSLGELGQFERAIELFRLELERNPHSLNCWGNLGLAYACQGEEQKAEQCLRRALELDPNYFNACCNLAGLLVRQDRLAEAAELLRRAVAIDSGRAKNWFARDERFAPWRDHPQFGFLASE
ncbi:MAG TPA: tetratricopeptide repeat protein [Polyangia bacterium]|nr:tetratricopeptide repeat protein [Polyangia bacterium]